MTRVDELDRARREAVTRLCQAQVDGLLSPHAFEERYALVLEAPSVAAVEAIMADLDHDAPGFLAPAEPEDLAAGSDLAPVSIRIPAVLGSTTRAGPWNVPDEIKVLVVLGKLVLDFRDASFVGDTVEIDASVTLGGLEVIVPPGTQVEIECREVLSSSSHKRHRRSAAPPNGLLVVVQGQLFMSELEIKEKPPTGEDPGLMERMGLDKVFGT